MHKIIFFNIRSYFFKNIILCIYSDIQVDMWLHLQLHIFCFLVTFACICWFIHLFLHLLAFAVTFVCNCCDIFSGAWVHLQWYLSELVVVVVMSLHTCIFSYPAGATINILHTHIYIRNIYAFIVSICKHICKYMCN